MADFEELLIRTSRTFALSIPLLPEPTRREVTLAYLLFRIADTFEDAAGWPREAKLAALAEFARLLAAPAPEATAAAAQRWQTEVPCANAGYRELLSEIPAVLEAFFTLAPGAVELIREHTLRTVHGMAGYVGRSSDSGELALADLADLRHYCYVVAGIVGELLTELFLWERPELAPAAAPLRRLTLPFGEGLQLVNILKDSLADATEGRRYLPGTDPATPEEIAALARQDLTDAAEYVLTLQRHGAERGLVAFTALPVHLAFATLRRFDEAGPGAKLSRVEVYSIVQHIHGLLDRGEPAMEPMTSPQPSPLLSAFG